MRGRVHFTKIKDIWMIQSLLVMNYFVSTMVAGVQEKAESTIPIATLSPPEGNTTFLGGTTWCVARPGASQVDLQIALDWACGLGMTNCNPIKPKGDCFEPNTLLSHASYAFNSYYQQNGNSDIACNFGGTATLTKHNPSYGKCNYAASGVSEVVSQVLNWTLASHNSLNKEAEHGKHSQPPILDLFDLKFRKCLRIIGESKRIV
ncbi:hypothetical protein IFM89_020005 [Coptis chinensis]|uniref:X8 domain-containing protein n=1 Tax=Coptis chinensis TaxID=261450 RepID=A0A835INT7_9MAGN|nr:hypothetical protein IFM89_020005 [Coptis chinensis]